MALAVGCVPGSPFQPFPEEEKEERCEDEAEEDLADDTDSCHSSGAARRGVGIAEAENAPPLLYFHMTSLGFDVRPVFVGHHVSAC